MDELNLDADLRQELRGKLDLKSLVEPAVKLVSQEFSELRGRFAEYRQKLAKYQPPLFEAAQKSV